jgi:hypothetical protein
MLGRADMRGRRILVSALLAVAVGCLALASAPAAEAAPSPQVAYLTPGPSLVKGTTVFLPLGDQRVGIVPVLVTTLQARLSRAPDPTAYISGIRGEELIWYLDGVEICRATTNLSGRASCRTSLDDELAQALGGLLGNRRLQVRFLGSSQYLPIAVDVPLLGNELDRDPPNGPL